MHKFINSQYIVHIVQIINSIVHTFFDVTLTFFNPVNLMIVDYNNIRSLSFFLDFLQLLLLKSKNNMFVPVVDFSIH